MVGIDEVGRGAWAGPLLVVAARAEKTLPVGLMDSKVLSKKKREELLPILKKTCDFGEGWVSNVEIDKLGLTKAMKLGVKRALLALGCQQSALIIMDGSINYCSDEYTKVECVIKADSLYPIVSAASIYAKVMRDNLMQNLAVEYPKYGFEKHVGYGTRLHVDGLKEFGVCELHRMSYRPVAGFA
ncbi:MAG TPA: ribonuclease HII [Candidatus Saccharibacteria bacterium]|nr:ribonuclease HII [Candidatus Saccharibacteria bacterium]